MTPELRPPTSDLRPLTAADTAEARTWVDKEQLHRDKKERALLIVAYLAGLKRAGQSLFVLLSVCCFPRLCFPADLTNAAYRVLTNSVSQANAGRAVSSFVFYRLDGTKAELTNRADACSNLVLGGTVTILAKTPALLRPLPLNPSAPQVFPVIRYNHAALHAARAAASLPLPAGEGRGEGERPPTAP